MDDEKDDGLGFFRGLVAGVAISLAMWLGAFLAAGWV
jgi:hypothetical protein